MPTGIDPRQHQPPLPVPEGLTREQIVASLITFSIDGGARGGLEGYAREDCDRFLYTLDLIPKTPLKMLEVGANPYFTTHLVRHFRPNASNILTNYLTDRRGTGPQVVSLIGFDGQTEERYELEYHQVNVETEQLPFEAGSFDLVLYGEVIEHMTNDPLRSLINIKRVLKPDGQLIVTTPNVARLENVARMVAGANIYDPYSGYGPYGRHNREYTRHELHRLLSYCGFEEEVFFTADVHYNPADDFVDTSRLADLLVQREPDLGQYLFTRWRNVGPPPKRKPAWLYRSYPWFVIDKNATL